MVIGTTKSRASTCITRAIDLCDDLANCECYTYVSFNGGQVFSITVEVASPPVMFNLGIFMLGLHLHDPYRNYPNRRLFFRTLVFHT